MDEEVVVGVALGELTVGIVRNRTGDLRFGGRVDVPGGAILTDLRPRGRTSTEPPSSRGGCRPAPSRSS